MGQAQHYRFDRAERLSEFINENGQSYRFRYDTLDRLVQEERIYKFLAQWAG